MAKLTDNDPCPIGKHKGERMIDVPASWLNWFLENGSPGNIMDYCIENKEAIALELKQGENKPKLKKL